jgi:type I restriction enzyme R subunit
MLLTGFDAPIAQVMYLDKKIQDHNLLQTIARVNRTSKNKFKGYIVDYYGLSDYLAEALEMFSDDDVQGALTNFKEELPKLKAAHTRLVAHFKGLDLNDLDECILSLHDEAKRQQFQTDFGRFAKQMDVVLPDASAKPFLGDLKRLGKIVHGARNLYRDEQLDISGAGEKVRQLIEEHIYSTGVNPKIAPIDLLAQDFKAKLDEHKSDRSKASEVENAIKDHIKVNLEQDPEYYEALSKRLGEIIKQNEEKWDSLVQMLLEFRGNIESDRQQQAQDIGLSDTEFAFHNILMAEVSRLHDEDVDEVTHQRVIAVVKQLVDMMQEATGIVDFFNKWNEVKAMKKRIKRTILSEDFGSKELVEAVSERFMDLAQAKFKVR